MAEKNIDFSSYREVVLGNIPISSTVKIEQLYRATEIINLKKNANIKIDEFENYFCILFCGIIRHYTKNNICSSKEQTLHFTLPGDILYQHNTLKKNEEQLHSTSKCIILAISYTFLNKIGEEIHFEKHTQKIIRQNLEKEIYLLRMTPEERYRELISKYRNIFQIVPSKYIASFLGLTPQSLCRIRKRSLLEI